MQKRALRLCYARCLFSQFFRASRLHYTANARTPPASVQNPADVCSTHRRHHQSRVRTSLLALTQCSRAVRLGRSSTVAAEA